MSTFATRPRPLVMRSLNICAYGECRHHRDDHKFDEVDGTTWCDECYGDADPRLRESAYHAFAWE